MFSDTFAPAVMAFAPAAALLGLGFSAVALVLIVSRHRQALAAMKHKTALELLQRGVVLPPGLLADVGPGRRYTDLRNGLVLAATGAGVIAFAFTLRRHELWGLGLIPLFAGLGYIATWLLTKPGKSSDDHA
jgi:hypothetical protein